jgi:DNA-binding CsgD family transcriptional regulator
MPSQNKVDCLLGVRALGEEWEGALDHPPPVTAREALAIPIGADLGSNVTTKTDSGVVLLYVCPFLNGAEGGDLAQRDAGRVGVTSPVPNEDEPAAAKLTPTEMHVLRQLAQGKTNRSIAMEMFISINTVKTHVRAIFQKCGVNTRGCAVTHAVAKGLIDWPPHPRSQNHPFGQYPKCN